jgi:transcriptional regulator with XRE-family HTH domain
MSKVLPGNIKFLRQKQGLTQEKLADLLGTTRASVCAYEDGRAMPPYPKLKALAEVLTSTVEDITELDLQTQKREAVREETRIVSVDTATEQTETYDLFSTPQPVTVTPTQKPQGNETEQWFNAGTDFPLKGCRILARKTELHEIADGSVYLIMTNSGTTLYRRVYDQNELRGVLVITPEVLHLETMDLPVSEVKEIWEFVSYQCSHPPRFPKTNTKLLTLLDEMQRTIQED